MCAQPAPRPYAPRPYAQVARAAATADARARILDAFAAMLSDRDLAAITLDEVAEAAASTRQTVIRYFGGKDGLLLAIGEHFGRQIRARRDVPDDAGLNRQLTALVADYEVVGEVVVQLLAQEARLPGLRAMLDLGRAGHREWVDTVFAAPLAALPPDARARRADQLYAATDVNIWKLYRSGFGHSAEHTAALMAEHASLLTQTPKEPT